MDNLIRRFDAERDGDLMLCRPRGVAWQADMKAHRARYDDRYLAKFEAYDHAIARAVNAGRCALLERHLTPGTSVLDVGAGDGAFVRAAGAAGFGARGYEVIPAAAEWLRREKLYAEGPHEFAAVTLWDVIEHLEYPEITLRAVAKGAHLFASVPVFESLSAIRASKHYRPGEHLYYWTAAGFVEWMSLYGFRLVETSAHETAAGREEIGAFAFKRDLPDYHDHIAAYQQLHATSHYGDSATELHLADAARVVGALRPRSIIDYGCGRSDLVAHFWRDGTRKIARFDPAIPAWKTMPEGRFALALCMDVMEHVPMASVERVLAEIRAKSDAALFTISTKPSRAKLPDGRNAHVTLLSKGEWTRWIAEVFGGAKPLASKWDHELMLLAGAAASQANIN